MLKYKTSCSRILIVLGMVLALGVPTGTLLGQGTQGTITGVVTDPSGSVVPDATVTVLNKATGVDFHLKSNSAGVYQITSLIPGKYTVTVSAKGFKTYVNHDLEVTVNQILRIDVTLEIGSETQTITVEAAAPLVNTEEGRLSAVVTASQVQNMPLNGRNIYDLMQLVPGAINSTSVNYEQTAGGTQTNINGTRANFNGFLLDGVSNKGLSGGTNAQPSPDFVQEFRIMTNDFSAQYGNSAGSVTDVSIKSGSNDFHGGVWEYLRNDKLNARNFFDGDRRSKWRQNQFGADFGGPIKKNKLFFFGGYEGERFRTESPQLITTETPAWRSAVQSTMPGSVATLLYKDFPAATPTTDFQTVDDVINSQAVNDIGAPIGSDYFDDGSTNTLVFNAYTAYTDPCFLYDYNGIGGSAYGGGPNWGNPQLTANRIASLVGVTPAENAQITTNIANECAGMGLVAPAIQGGAISRTANMLGSANGKFATRTAGVFYNGDQWTSRGDYQGDKLRVFGRFISFLYKDPNVTTASSAYRGFLVPATHSFPSAAVSIVYNFTPNIVNEFRAGYTRNQLANIPDVKTFGVPAIGFDSGDAQFGAYNGYPQFFHENVYNYMDLVSLVKGKHSLKFGGEYKRNIENSEFNVGRPSYYFFDQFYFAADLPYWEAAGVNPELISGGSSHIDTNIRAWRNYELGFFVQDDWKVKKNLTLNFGLRYDYYGAHTEKYGKITSFTFGPGSNAEERLASINCQATLNGQCAAPAGDTQTPNGGFVVAKRLFKPDRNNFSPRFGFAWDPRGNGKTSIRGGFAVFYESSFYNSLSNSRWNLPFYSFNIASPIAGYSAMPVYGPTNADGTPNLTATPTYGGAPDNIGQGPAALNFQGNIDGWFPGSPNLAYLTGIPDPTMRSPYVENGFFGFQHQISSSMVFEANYVMTLGKKLMWAENPNRVVNGKARGAITNPCTGASKSTPLVNPCFGTLRTWENSVTSNYNGLQLSLNKKMSRGLAISSSYTWSHTLDFRSSWHGLTSGGSATEANPYGSSGYSLDPSKVFLEYGNSLFDVRHRWVTAVQWEMPWMRAQHGAAGKIFGGWQMNWNIALQSGFPFTVGARKDYNKDGLKSDRPDAPDFGSRYPFNNQDFIAGSGRGGNSLMKDLKADFLRHTPSGTDGTLGRNTYRGPGLTNIDFSLFKKIPVTERVKLDFRAEFFNLTNRVNLYQPNAALNSSLFGYSDTAFDPRVIQFGLKMTF